MSNIRDLFKEAIDKNVTLEIHYLRGANITAEIRNTHIASKAVESIHLREMLNMVKSIEVKTEPFVTAEFYCKEIIESIEQQIKELEK